MSGNHYPYITEIEFDAKNLKIIMKMGIDSDTHNSLSFLPLIGEVQLILGQPNNKEIIDPIIEDLRYCDDIRRTTSNFGKLYFNL